MIQVRLYGRLGNQMFQIATCIATALRNKTDYSIPQKSVNPKEWKTYFTQFPRRIPSGGRIWREPTHGYTPIPNERSIILDGYFQSEKYFKEYREQLLQMFGFKWIPIARTVSIHVRRGDYLQLQDKHPVVTEKYLIEAMNYFKEKGYNEFMFFSDDIKWCKEKFPNNQYSEGLGEKADMELMSCCEHHIIANSSFSWWGAWLNQNPNKIVVCPSKNSWFGINNKHLDTKDLIPESWVQIDF